MSFGFIHVHNEHYGVLRKSARLNPTNIPIQLFTPHLLQYTNLIQSPTKTIIYDSIEPTTLYPSFSNAIANDSNAQNDVLDALQLIHNNHYNSHYDYSECPDDSIDCSSITHDNSYIADNTYIDDDNIDDNSSTIIDDNHTYITYSTAIDNNIDGDIIIMSYSSNGSSDSDSDNNSDSDLNDAIESLPSDDTISLEFTKNSLKQTLQRLQYRMDFITYGTYMADIEWSVSINDLHAIAFSITSIYYQ